MTMTIDEDEEKHVAQEIERRFLPSREVDWPQVASRVSKYRQSYIRNSGSTAVRRRLVARDDIVTCLLTIKQRKTAATNDEINLEINREGYEDMASMCGAEIVKTRYDVKHAGMVWEVDVYDQGDPAIPVVIEIEIPSEDFDLEMPDWVGREVTGDRWYSNEAIAKRMDTRDSARNNISQISPDGNGARLRTLTYDEADGAMLCSALQIEANVAMMSGARDAEARLRGYLETMKHDVSRVADLFTRNSDISEIVMAMEEHPTWRVDRRRPSWRRYGGCEVVVTVGDKEWRTTSTDVSDDDMAEIEATLERLAPIQCQRIEGTDEKRRDPWT